MALWLNDRLVLKHFGKRPWLGKAMRMGMMTTHAGMVFKQMYGKDIGWEPSSIQLAAVTIALKPTGKPGMWEVHCKPEYREQVEMWLIDNLRGVPKPVKRSRKTPERVKPRQMMVKPR